MSPKSAPDAPAEGESKPLKRNCPIEPRASSGLTEEQASGMIVSGFVEPITKELPLEYAVELNRLIQLQMEGSVG